MCNSEVLGRKVSGIFKEKRKKEVPQWYQGELDRLVGSFEDNSSQPVELQILSHNYNLLKNSETTRALDEVQINEKNPDHSDDLSVSVV